MSHDALQVRQPADWDVSLRWGGSVNGCLAPARAAPDPDAAERRHRSACSLARCMTSLTAALPAGSTARAGAGLPSTRRIVAASAPTANGREVRPSTTTVIVLPSLVESRWRTPE